MVKKYFKLPLPSKKISEKEQKNCRTINQDNSKVSKQLNENKNYLQMQFKGSVDVVFYEFRTFSEIRTLVVYIEELVKKEVLDRDIINNFIGKSKEVVNSYDKLSSEDIKMFLSVSNISESKKLDNIIEDLVEGSAVIFIDGFDTAFLIPIRGWEKRAIEEPESESVVRGPREGFVESININRALLRRKIKNRNLAFENIILGRQTRTNVNLAYIDGIVNTRILEEVKERLAKIDIDAVLDSGYIEEFIKDEPLSPFNTVGNTERPDIVAGKILEGRIAILCDGSPNVLTVPFIFIENFQSNEDYYNNFVTSSLNRMTRFTSFILSTMVPAIYIALVTYHQEMIPSKLLFSFISSREGVPFPTVVETLMMIFVFELLRETGVRMPGAFGQTISIVGALILGTAAVDAKFVSAPVVIVVAITGISSFLIHKILGAVIITRVILAGLGSVLGLYGVMFGVIVLFLYLVSIRSFGVPYMTNLSSLGLQEIKDTIIRAPWWYMYFRPRFISKANIVRKR